MKSLMRTVCAILAGTFIHMGSAAATPENGVPIDRQALVSRHDVTWTTPYGVMPLGNGGFCFNADGTGLQTFGGNTMAHWAWHSFPMPAGWTTDQIPGTGTFQKGRSTGGDDFPPGTGALRDWMYHNPHGLNLGRLRLHWSDGREVAASEITNLSCHLSLWSGILTSGFELNNATVHIETCVHPKLDTVAVRIESPMLASGKLEVALDFPYPSLENGAWAGDFSKDDKHMTSLTRSPANVAEFLRKVDATTYHVRFAWPAGSDFQERAGPGQTARRFVLRSQSRDTMEFTCSYSSRAMDADMPSFAETRNTCAACREAYWKSGGAIDLSGSKDPRWFELERRIVLSQYQMAAQSSGGFPPAETGLMGIDAWGSRFHMEMAWWHLAHYALWDRWSMANKALGVYQRFMPASVARAKQLDEKGAEWPKGVGPDGISQPWVGNLALLWKQPHPIFFVELDYRLHPTRATLDKWADIVRQTAENMADYPTLDAKTGIYSLVPDMPPSELGITRDAVFDLAYWRWAIDKAQEWRQRLGLTREPHWSEVRTHLAPLPVRDGVFVHSAEWTDTYTKRAWEHPDPVGVFGMLPPIEGVDRETAHRTVLRVWQTWNWNRGWGWDFPWMAMAAARVGEPQIAVDALLKDARTNAYDWRGVCNGSYLPGNGGLLYAIAMMAAGWDGAPARPAPGFPNGGSWLVKWEGLKKAP